MPVARRRALYGDNPQQSQFNAGGSIYVSGESQGDSLVTLPSKIFSIPINGSSPPLGYTWEIINFGIPFAFYIELKGEAPKAELEQSLETSITIRVGSQILYVFRLSAKPSFFSKQIKLPAPIFFSGYYNIFLNEAAPVPLVIPPGQQVFLDFQILRSQKPFKGAFISTVVVGQSYNQTQEEPEEFITGHYDPEPVPSSINYRFV